MKFDLAINLERADNSLSMKDVKTIHRDGTNG